MLGRLIVALLVIGAAAYTTLAKKENDEAALSKDLAEARFVKESRRADELIAKLAATEEKLAEARAETAAAVARAERADVEIQMLRERLDEERELCEPSLTPRHPAR